MLVALQCDNANIACLIVRFSDARFSEIFLFPCVSLLFHLNSRVIANLAVSIDFASAR